MINLRKALLVTVISASLAVIPAPSVKAATLDVDVDIHFPQIVVLYAYTNIELSITTAGLADALHTGATVSGSDATLADALPNNTTGITDMTTAIDLDIASDTQFDLNADPVMTLNNAFGVRSLGYTGYSATVSTTGTELISPTVTTPANTGLTLSTGNLSYTVDLDAVTGTAASGTFTITVTGT